MELPLLETPRLALFTPTPADAGRMLEYAVRNREHLAPWEPLRPAAYFTLPHWTESLTAAVEAVGAGKSLPLVLAGRGDRGGPILGVCTLSQIVRGPFQAAYLGYSLDREAEGQGLMAEALEAAIGHAFSGLELHRVMANYMPRNERSGRLLRRLGFTVEGYARDYLKIAGAWEDHILTSRIYPGARACGPPAS